MPINNIHPLNLSQEEIDQAFNDPEWAENYPPVLTVSQVAELFQVPKATVYEWSSLGKFQGCCRRVGKHLRFYRNRTIRKLFNERIK